jgi:hypothetical protein
LALYSDLSKKGRKKNYFFMFNLGEERKRYIGGGIELG